jgi:PAS domain S-box-containing protein
LSGHERLETGSTRVVRFHSILDSVYCALIRIRNPDELFGEICRAIGRSGLFRQAWIGLIDPATMVVKRVASTDDSASNFDQLCLSAEQSTVEGDLEARAIMAGKCFISNDIETDPRHISWRLQALQQGYRSCAFVPLKLGDRLIGVFKLYSGEVDLFGDYESKSLESLATAISCALTMSRHEEHRRKAEQELRESEDRYRRIVENMIGLVSQLDAQRLFQFASPTCKSVLGYDPEELLGKSFLAFAHADDANGTELAFRAAEKSHSTARVELRFRRAGRQYVWLEMAVDPVFDESDRLVGFMCASRNIGERKEAEEKVRRYTSNLEKLVRERSETIRILNETTTQRLIQKINQINHISEIRDSLKRSQGLQSSCQTILESAIRDLNMSAGVILTIDAEKNLAEVQAFKPVDKAASSKKTYSLDIPLAEYECIKSRRPISRIVAKEASVLGTLGLHCSPILFLNEPAGLIALGRASGEALDESDLSVLRLYSGLVTTALETTSLSVEPTRETYKAREGKYKLEFGSNYLIVDNIDLAYDMFTDTIMSGTEGLCITRKVPRKLREMYGLKRTPIVWLTSERVDGERTINSLQDLSILISNYVDKAQKPLILVDGVEYLISHQGFDSVYHFLQAKGTQVEAAGGTILVPFFKETLEPRQVKLLEREFSVFKQKEKSKEVDVIQRRSETERA